MENYKSWKHQLLDDYYEEISDAHKYLKLSEDAEKESFYHTAQTLELMAHDEMTHARFLRDKLEEWGIPHAAKEEEWEALERHFAFD